MDATYSTSATVGFVLKIDLELLPELKAFIAKLGGKILYQSIAHPGEFLRIVNEAIDHTRERVRG